LEKTAAGRVGHQLMVTIAWRRQAQRLQNTVDMRRRRQISAAGHERNPLDRVVGGKGQVIARRHVLAGEHDIIERSGIRQLPMRPVFFLVDPLDRASQSERPSEVEPQRVICPRALLPDALLRLEGQGMSPDRAVLIARAAHHRDARSRPGSRDACRSTDRRPPSP